MEGTLEFWQEQKEQREKDIALEKQRDEDIAMIKMLLAGLQEANDKITQLTDGI